MKFLKRYALVFLVSLWGCTATGPWYDSDYDRQQQIRPVEGSTLIHRVFLLGDTGAPVLEGDDPTLSLLDSLIRQTDSRSTAVFLGDNVYPDGIEPDSLIEARKESEAKLLKNLNSLTALNGNAFFIPGNHDWYSGLNGVIDQKKIIDEFPSNNPINYLPRPGCPGPDIFILDDHPIAFIFLDSQWFLLQKREEIASKRQCPYTTSEAVEKELSRLVQKHNDKLLIVATHHPFFGNASHGGYFPPKDHLFPLTNVHPALYIPLPVIGSIYPLVRNMGVSKQDVSNPTNKEYQSVVLNSISDHPNVILASGHEHILQYSQKNQRHFIISGAGTKKNEGRKGGKADFVYSDFGFATIDIYDDGSVWAAFWTPVSPYSRRNPIFRTKLEDRNVNIKTSNSTDQEEYSDLVTTAADSQYLASKIHEFVLGEHYRETWATPITLPVLDLWSDSSEYNILGSGSGQQTKTYFIEDHSGRRFVLRSLNKDPTEALPQVLRSTFASNLLQDQISASYPFAELIIHPLSETAGIYSTTPEIAAFPGSPDNPPNTIAVLEEFISESWIQNEFGHNAKLIIETEELFSHLLNHPEKRIDREWMVRTRLFDMLINDWDRHEGQYFWVEVKRHERTSLFRPFPIDRDNAFFVTDGLLPTLASREWGLRKFQHFEEDIRDMAGMNFQARHLDRRFLATSSEEQWIDEAQELKKVLTDSVIEEAVSNLPAPLYELNGARFIRILKTRRDNLVDFARRYHEILAEKIDWVGTNSPDLFTIRNSGPNKLIITRETDLSDGHPAEIESLSVNTNQTQQIRIYGMDGNDRFNFQHTSELPVELQIVGGPGENESIFQQISPDLQKNVFFHSVKIPDRSQARLKENTLTTTQEMMKNYGYNYQEFEYDRYTPLLDFSLNKDDGLFVGGGVSYTGYDFRKYPYSFKHKLAGNVALKTGSFNFNYRGEFINRIGNADLLLNTDIRVPNFQTNFFGFGNGTEKLGDNSFHTVRIDQYIVQSYVKYRIHPSVSLMVGPAFELFKPRRNSSRFVSLPESGLADEDFTLNPFGVFRSTILFDQTTEQPVFKKGVALSAAAEFNYNFNDRESFVRIGGTAKTFMPIERIRTTFATRVGGSSNFGAFEFYQANTLGGQGIFSSDNPLLNKSNLRGTPRHRFSGHTVFYHNSEARTVLFDVESLIIPGQLGLLILFDHGRVWSDIPQEPELWHYSYGGGIWYNLFERFIINTTLASSDTDHAFTVNINFMF